jgi:co-chaperonin GroES (HSP10)
MVGVKSDRVPLTREQIKAKRPIDSYVSPHFQDGGWHATPGVEEWFDPRELRPMHDRILVEILPQKTKYENVILPENVQLNEPSRYARVIRIGKGERVLPNEEHRSCCCVRPDDVVIIGLHHDWQSQDGRYVIAQEEDVRVILRGDVDSLPKKPDCGIEAT